MATTINALILDLEGDCAYIVGECGHHRRLKPGEIDRAFAAESFEAVSQRAELAFRHAEQLRRALLALGIPGLPLQDQEEGKAPFDTPSGTRTRAPL